MKILFENRKTIEFLSGLDELSANADMLQTLEVEMNVPLTSRESLWIKYESADKSFTAEKEHLIAHNYVDTIPEDVLRLPGMWKLQLFIREYDKTTGNFITKAASNIATFTVAESLQIEEGGAPVSAATVAALYSTAVEKINIETDTAQKVETLDQKVEELDQKYEQSVTELEDGKVNRAGDTMTGPLKVEDTSTAGPESTDYTAQGVEIIDERNRDYTSYKKDSISRVIADGDEFVIRLPQVGGTLARESQIQDAEEWISSAIDGIREDIRNEAHFRGYVATNAEIQALKADDNDYAYSAESGTVWIYQGNAWTNSGRPVPDQSTPASNSTPLMDGTASAGTAEVYARGDHVHPTDTTLAKTIDGEVMYDGIEKKNLLILRLYNANNELITAFSVDLPESNGGGGEGGTIVTVDGIAQETWDADTKVDKVTGTSGFNRIYGIPNGATYTTYYDLQYPAQFTSESDARRRDGVAAYSGGRLGCAPPERNYEATNKKYVDDGFVAKQTGTPDSGATRGFLYGLQSDGTTPNLYKVQIQANPDTIPLRNPNGNFYVGTPTLAYEAVNKGYVDELVLGADAESYSSLDEMAEDISGGEYPSIYELLAYLWQNRHN